MSEIDLSQNPFLLSDDEQESEDVLAPLLERPVVEDVVEEEEEEEEEEPVSEPEEIVPEPVEPEVDDGRSWYVIHCYSGYENKVSHNLEQRIETMEMQDKIFDVVVPTEEEIEVKEGKRRTVERRVFPGYILVQMLENYFVVPKVLGEAVELHPLVVISGVLIGAAVWGILGALLATPLIASGREIIHYLYRKTLGEDPFPTIEKPPEEETLSLRESMQNLVAKSQQALKRDSDSSKDQSETELDD